MVSRASSRPQATSATIHVEGLDEFRRELRRAGAQLPKALATANKQAGEIVADEAKRRAPQGAHQGGGAITPIVESIRALQQQRQAVVAIGSARTPHAQAYEFGGTLRRFHSQTRTRVPKRPYLFPAIEAKRQAVIDAYATLVIDETANRAFPE